MLTIRPAAEDDLSDLCALDDIARVDPARRQYLERVVAARVCHLALTAGRAVGYVVLEYTFFGQGFVSLLYVAADDRRRGIGSALMEYSEAICSTAKLFTSTNLSNHPMQALLARRGYKLSGVIHDLDEGDPELIYVKLLPGLRGNPRQGG